jgi:hypothetical protein
MSYDPALGFPGDFVFHYTTRDAALGHILPTRRLRLSPAWRMRDPLESKPGAVPSAYAAPTGRRAAAAVQRTAAEATWLLHQRRGCSKILSLTVDAPGYQGDAEIFGRGYTRARMWEQYAEQHMGVCLMFHRERLHERVLTELSNRTTAAWAAEVTYTQRGLLGDSAASTLTPSVGQEAADAVERHIQQHWKAIFFTKLLDWQSEHEFRYVESSIDAGCTYVDIGDTLAGVMVGQEFPSWQIPALLSICEEVGAVPWQMTWKLSRPWPHQLTLA